MQSAEPLMRNDATKGYGASSPPRRSLPEPEMRSVLMTVGDAIEEESLQMPLVQSDDVVDVGCQN
jgi:hypothetical protein